MKRLRLLSLLLVPAFYICLLLSAAAPAVEQGMPHYSGSNDDFGLGDFEPSPTKCPPFFGGYDYSPTASYNRDVVTIFCTFTTDGNRLADYLS